MKEHDLTEAQFRESVELSNIMIRAAVASRDQMSMGVLTVALAHLLSFTLTTKELGCTDPLGFFNEWVKMARGFVEDDMKDTTNRRLQ